MNKFLLAVSLFLAAALLFSATFLAEASPAPQAQYPSPTPGTDGRIIYIVKAGDTCTQISLLYNVSLEYLRQTNHLNENCELIEGQQLVIGLGGPAAASPTPTAGSSPTPLPPTPTAIPGYAEVCVALYDDVNGDAKRQANTDELDNYLADGTEPTLAGGAVSLTSTHGTYSKTLDTLAGLEPICFSDVPEGEYTLSMAVPDNYNPTTVLNSSLIVTAGDTTFFAFGAQPRTQAEQTGDNSRFPALLVFGAFLVLSGAGLGIYAWRIRK